MLEFLPGIFWHRQFGSPLTGSPPYYTTSLCQVDRPRCPHRQGDRLQVSGRTFISSSLCDSKISNTVVPSNIEHTMYVLNVDLWSEDAITEVNLVRHNTATPSISSTTPASYAAIEQSTPAFSHILPSNRDVGYPQQIPYQTQSPAVNPYAMQSPYSGMSLSKSPTEECYCPVDRRY